MKILMLSVGLALICGLQALSDNMEDPQMFTGEWFTVALASNVSSKIEEGGGLQLFVKSLGERDGVLIGDFFKRTFLWLIGLLEICGLELMVRHGRHWTRSDQHGVPISEKVLCSIAKELK
ncbi:minor allergen Can f 2-like isoform X1 [Trichosurus vulpecula]|uniref:minor allergen Can f 2-like isoform X1 n=1 Tax=Trichosurus vulpecula TaxID=9337 RepID=UPI00186B46C8|nr:minor allergen Can f 2-like isoform X1 [Trichosurus vulpecula]